MAIMSNNKIDKRSKIVKVALLAWLREGKQLFKFHGSNEEIQAMVNAFLSSKALHEEINKSSSTVQSVMLALENMRRDTKKFERMCGVKWPL